MPVRDIGPDAWTGFSRNVPSADRNRAVRLQLPAATAQMAMSDSCAPFLWASRSKKHVEEESRIDKTEHCLET